MTASKVESSTATSHDGTRIVFERHGEGPTVILVEPALHYREFSAFEGLVPLLVQEFTVVVYDRRGRGESADSQLYAPDREVDDIAAVISAVGGPALLYGYSSGALLAMRAAARGLPVARMALLEPPLKDDDAERPDPLTTALAGLIREGNSGEAVDLFHKSIGVPEELIAEMAGSPQWEKMVKVAPTLVYDCMISDASNSDLLRSIEIPTLVLDSQGSSDDLTGWAASVADQLPNATHRSLPGEWHGVADETLAAALTPFFKTT